MEVVNIDVLDGNGMISVAVSNSIQAIRLRHFVREAIDAIAYIKALEGEQITDFTHS